MDKTEEGQKNAAASPPSPAANAGTAPVADVPNATNAPKWAVGIALIISTTLNVFVAAYLVVTGDVGKYLDNKKTEIQTSSQERKEAGERETSAILTLVTQHSEQVKDLSQSVGSLTAAKAALETRVSALENQYSFCKEELEKCRVAK